MADSTISKASSGRSRGAMPARLSAMMFLQYFPLGAWGVTYGTYIAANTGAQGARIFSAGFGGFSTSAGAIGSLLSPLLIGFLSDRYFAAQHLLALMHVGCGIAAWGMFATHSQSMFFLLLLSYYQCFSPAAALTNKIALKHLANVNAEYPIVRIFSTVGWIAAGLFVGLAWPYVNGISIEARAIPLLIGSIGNFVMAAYCLTLPRTPPEAHTGVLLIRAVRDVAELLRNPSLVAFLLVAILACISGMAYNNFANLFLNTQHYSRPAALMTLGQVSDLMFLAVTPLLISRFDLYSLFCFGIAAWAARYWLLAAGSLFHVSWLVHAAILMNGPCFVFIFVVGVLYVDRLVAASHRGAAQGMFIIVTGGIANLFGAVLVGLTQARLLTPDGISPPPYHWIPFWTIPALVCTAAFLLTRVRSRSINRQLQ